MDGITGQDSIADHWRHHFHNILNANDCDKAMKDEIMEKLKKTKLSARPGYGCFD